MPLFSAILRSGLNRVLSLRVVRLRETEPFYLLRCAVDMVAVITLTPIWKIQLLHPRR
ncbi:hypothetical protein M407DRAFT_243070 [Tulasnella calospora MUT 4182]|uniref:Uncharacterized protein n=1 Tax=Tulasnella calospora MUT 4182 TaxID=1051891 RepID=A0A0C3QC80_9AGAM|nr:hypothetical protein M407DRAFT_243070 [Tulasnella calospora MUT 4182]